MDFELTKQGSCYLKLDNMQKGVFKYIILLFVMTACFLLYLSSLSIRMQPPMISLSSGTLTL